MAVVFDQRMTMLFGLHNVWHCMTVHNMETAPTEGTAKGINQHKASPVLTLFYLFYVLS